MRSIGVHLGELSVRRLPGGVPVLRPGQRRAEDDLTGRRWELATYGLAKVDRAGEIDRSRKHLAGIEVIVPDGNLTLKVLVDALREGIDILHLVCHGALKGGTEPSLSLEDGEGKVARVESAAYARLLPALPSARANQCMGAHLQCTALEETREEAEHKTAARTPKFHLLDKTRKENSRQAHLDAWRRREECIDDF